MEIAVLFVLEVVNDLELSWIDEKQVTSAQLWMHMELEQVYDLSDRLYLSRTLWQKLILETEAAEVHHFK